MKTISRILFALMFVFAVPAMAATAQESFINDLGQKAITLLSSNTPVAQRHAEFSKLFYANFDLPKIGKFVLGRHWNEASADQQAQYQKLFSKMVVTVYTQRFDNYAGQKFTVKGSTPVDGVDTDTVVHSQIEQPDGQAPIDVDWRVRATGGSYKIIDVMVGGVSMSVTQRSEYDSIIQQSGIDGLLKDMQNRMNNGTADSAMPAGKTK